MNAANASVQSRPTVTHATPRSKKKYPSPSQSAGVKPTIEEGETPLLVSLYCNVGFQWKYEIMNFFFVIFNPRFLINASTKLFLEYP